MKKTLTIILLFIIILSMLLSTVACDVEDADAGSTTTTTTVTTTTTTGGGSGGSGGGGNGGNGGDGPPQAVTGTGEERFNGVNFGGKSVTITMSNCQDPSRVGASVAKYMAGADDKGNVDTEDTILMSVKNRNDYVTGKLGLQINYDYMSEGWQDLATAIKTRYDAHDRDNPIDGVANQLSSIYELMMMGIFRNVSTTAKTNYFDFTDKSWYADTMQSLSFGADMAEGKKFILAGDYFIDIIRCIDVIIVNENRLSTIGWSTDSFYELITNGEWDYDYFNSLVDSAFSAGPTGDPSKTDENDNLGLVYYGSKTNNVFAAAIAMAMVHSADIDYIAAENGNFKYLNNSTVNTSFSTLAEKATLLVENRGTLAVEAATDARTVFAGGNTLFVTGMRLYDLENVAFDSIPKNAIPFPKLNMGTDKYKAYIHDNASVGAIFNTSDRFTEFSAFWQYCTIKSEATRIKYYNDGLGLKYDTAGSGSHTKSMLDILYNNMTVDDYVLDVHIRKSSVDEVATPMFSLLMAVASGDSELSSAWETALTHKVNGLASAVQKYNNLNKD